MYSAHNRLMTRIVSIGFLILFSIGAFAHGMSDADKQAIIEGGNLHYMWIGATHMLSGYDHLAFVFGIIFFLTSFKDIAKYVTAFTLGHSITLIYATFYSVQLNYFAIDAVIGLSVSYIAFANIDGFRKYLNINPPNMMLMIIGLGLIHGFGLSTRLQQLPLSGDHLLLNIISFNVGIELGQISALALMLLGVTVWRKRESFKAFSVIANYTLVIAGFLLFLMQMHGYVHSSTPEEFIVEKSVKTAPAVTRGKVDDPPWKDSFEIPVPARGEIEYKLAVQKGKSFTCAWQSSGPALVYDFHAEPANDNNGYFKTFKKGSSASETSQLTAIFDGTHGWYWKNNAPVPVTVFLTCRGNYQLKSDQFKQ